jgi:hypothetical protein
VGQGPVHERNTHRAGAAQRGGCGSRALLRRHAKRCRGTDRRLPVLRATSHDLPLCPAGRYVWSAARAVPVHCCVGVSRHWAHVVARRGIVHGGCARYVIHCLSAISWLVADKVGQFDVLFMSIWSNFSQIGYIRCKKYMTCWCVMCHTLAFICFVLILSIVTNNYI